MNSLTNTGYGTLPERMREVSIGLPFPMPTSGSFIMSIDKNNGNYKHGLWNHNLYIRWSSIKQRCYNQNNYTYKHYGGRGIKVCDEWRHNFMSFYDYVTALPNYGEAGMTIDRMDTYGDYEPGNVRWADMHTQIANQRMQRNNTSGYVGVSWHHNKYRCSIMVNGELIDLGRFHTIEDAVSARNQYIINNNLIEYKIQEYNPY